MPLGGTQNAQSHTSGHLIRTLGGHQYQWDLHPLWAIRTQSSDHPTLKVGCTTGQSLSPARLPLDQMHATPAATGLRLMSTSSLVNAASDYDFMLDICSARFDHVSSLLHITSYGKLVLLAFITQPPPSVYSLCVMV